MQLAGLMQLSLSSRRRPPMPSQDWSGAFRVTRKRKTQQDHLDSKAALRGQGRTAPGLHQARWETDITRSSRVSSLPFLPMWRALKSQADGCSRRWQWGTQADKQVWGKCVTTLTHFTAAAKQALFPSFPLFFLPQFPMQGLPPSSTITLPSQGQPNTLAQSEQNIMPTLLAVSSHLPLSVTILSHTQTFPPPDQAPLLLVLTSTLETAFKTLIEGFPPPVTELTHIHTALKWQSLDPCQL